MDSIINGSDLLILVGTKAIGHCTTHTTSYTAETKERMFKPAASEGAGAGLWADKAITKLSIAISFEGLRCSDETEEGFDELLAAYATGAPITVKGKKRGADGTYLEGSFVITSLEEVAPAGDDATYSGQLENSGQPTKFASSAQSS